MTDFKGKTAEVGQNVICLWKHYHELIHAKISKVGENFVVVESPKLSKPYHIKSNMFIIEE